VRRVSFDVIPVSQRDTRGPIDRAPYKHAYELSESRAMVQCAMAMWVHNLAESAKV
jgi:hypothetical protein